MSVCAYVPILNICIHVSLQDTQLYFDPDRGCYYDYDPVTRQYSFHSRVTIANKEKEREEERKRKKKLHEEIIDLCSTSSEELGDWVHIVFHIMNTSIDVRVSSFQS